LHTASELRHGGRLRVAAREFGIPLPQWLDLSTGINPDSWPVPPLPAEVWRRLPEDNDGLDDAARNYFGTAVLPVAGSQAAIQALPRLYSPRKVAILSPCYGEHEHAWRLSGHATTRFSYSEHELALDVCDVLILTNPNNPTGHTVAPEQLLEWHAQLAKRGSLLLVDEAFIDCTPQASIMLHTQQPGLIVLRSLGKFFGLAGLRCGFVAAEVAVLGQLKASLGPWALSHPARWLARRALADHAWQAQARELLRHRSERLSALLAKYGLPSKSGCALFRWVAHAQPEVLRQTFAQHSILIRSFPEYQGLRFGLPGGELEWHKLDCALREITG